MDGPLQAKVLLRTAVGLSLFVSLISLHSVEALPLGDDGSPQPGTWGDWGQWSPCTRTCGGGVSTQQRTCISGSCIGPDKQFQSCCVEPCPVGTPSFRELQCSLLNHTQRRWRAQSEGKEGCELYCVGDDPTVTLVVADTADGTPCHTSVEGLQGVCVAGMCVQVGCDGVLGSKKERDGCLQCVGAGGEGGQECVKHSDVTAINRPQTGYVEVLQIPKGAMRVKVSQSLDLTAPNQGHLALRSSAHPHTYYLMQGCSGGTYNTSAGSAFTYSVSDPPHRVESLLAEGPLMEDVAVELYVGDASSQITYEFYTLKSKAQPTDASPDSLDPTVMLHDDEISEFEGVDFGWLYGDFSNCSATCGLGFKTSLPLCKDLAYPDRDIPEAFCLSNDLPRPLPIQRQCSLQACPPRWRVGEWTSCEGGYQERVTECVQMLENGVEEIVTRSLCKGVGPIQRQECNDSPCQAQWWEGEWGECSAQCGSGVQQRSVACRALSGETVHEQYCTHLSRPPTSQTCSQNPCLSDCSWSMTKWRCNVTCGQGRQFRHLRTHACRYANGRRASDTCCMDKPVPPTEAPCYETRRCELISWDWGSYGPCTGECGQEGTRVREVRCVGVMGGQSKVLPDSLCNATTRPSATVPCTRRCCTWNAHEWGECSSTCGLGQQYREVTCLLDGQLANCCDENTKPITLKFCPNNSTCQPPPDPCFDDPGPNCADIAQRGWCSNDYFRLVCCATCRAALAAG